MTLKRRLVFFFIAVIAVGAFVSFALISLSTQTLFRSFVFSGDAVKAERYAHLLADYYREHGGWNGAAEYIDELASAFFHRSGFSQNYSYETNSAGSDQAVPTERIVLTDDSGVVIADSSGELLGSVHPRRHLAHGIPVKIDSSIRGTVMVGSMVNSSLGGTDERFLISVMVSLLGSTLLSAGLAFLFGLIFAARVTRPITVLNSAVKRIADGDLSAVVPEVGRDEVTELSASFNSMARELERLETAKKRIIADAAHELRTPTTLIRGTIEGMIDGVFPLDVTVLKSVHEETLRLSRLIDTLRELELIESGKMKLELAEVDVAETASRAVSLFAAAAGERGIRLSVVVGEPRPPFVTVDPFRLDEVVYNLLSNAVKYSSGGGTVRVGVFDDAESRGVRLTVDDSGPGIAPEERERVFERFYRTDSSRCDDSGGRGLGLAIVAEIVKAHGGSVAVADSDLGGASFVVRLPAGTPR